MEPPPCPSTSIPTSFSATPSTTRRHLKIPDVAAQLRRFAVTGWPHGRPHHLSKTHARDPTSPPPSCPDTRRPSTRPDSHGCTTIKFPYSAPLPPRPDPTPSRSPLPTRTPVSPTRLRSHSPSRHKTPKVGMAEAILDSAPKYLVAHGGGQTAPYSVSVGCCSRAHVCLDRRSETQIFGDPGAFVGTEPLIQRFRGPRRKFGSGMGEA
jgi:hypothetical protein